MSGRQSFVGSGRQIEGGALAARKQDLIAHSQGNYIRHLADQIDMVVPIPNLLGTTVEAQMHSLEGLFASVGSGFISIGNAGPDGYSGPDGYALGSYNVNTVATPTLQSAMQAALLDSRLKGGGVLLILSGTYVLTGTVEIPAGITIMGEDAGTLIIGQMANVPMFTIDGYATEYDIGGNDGTGNILINSGSSFWKTKFVNIMLSDNLGGTIASGSASMTSVPIISLKKGANLECSNVTFMGRLNSGTILNRAKTSSAIATTSGTTFGTTLTCHKCFFDGFKSAVVFSPSSGDQDFLTITDCKIRTYGIEGASASFPTGLAGDSCIVASLCNAVITNNYYVGAGTWANVFLNLQTTSGTKNVRVVVSGNSGSPFSTTSSALVKNSTAGNTFDAVIANNNWGINIDSPWTIIVGGSSGKDPAGDIFGVQAINTILSLANSNNFQATVIVNPGTYVVNGSSNTVNNYCNLKFIGNKNGKNYPVFQLGLSSLSTDILGNQFLILGNHIEGIEFQNATLFSGTSIIPAFNATSYAAQTPAHFLHIKDCIFKDITLYLMDIGSAPFTDTAGDAATLHTIIEDCRFLQTGTYTDNLSLSIPRCNTVLVKNCNFLGNGYALNIGNTKYTSAAIADASYLLENCTFDQTGYTITTASPTGVSNYILINDVTAKVTVRNCQILATSTLGNATANIGGGLPAAGTFTKFAYIVGRDTEIIDCIVNGPAQTFTSSAVAYNMPSLFIESKNSARIYNTKFYGGALPLQFGGTNFTQGSVFVQGCEFTGTATSGQYTQLDIDFNYTTIVANKYTIIISNNTFKGSTITDALVLHANMNSASYNAHGVVQIYANNYDVIFSNNKIQTSIPASPASYTHYSGAVINCYDSSTNSGTRPCSIAAHDNSIGITNLYFSGSATNTATSMWIKSADAKIHNNYFQFYNFAAVGPVVTTNLSGCLYVNTSAINAYSDSVVTGNTFSSRDNFGNSTTGTAILVGGFVIIDSSSSRGRIVDNSFSDTTLDGSNTALVYDQTSQPKKWLVANNKNQTESFQIRGNLGIVSNLTNTNGGNHPQVVTGGTALTNPVVEFWDLASPSYTYVIKYTTGSGALSFNWNVPLYDILPKGVIITSVSIKATSDHSMTAGNLGLYLTGTTPSILTAATPALDFTTASYGTPNTVITPTITPGNTGASDTFVNNPSEALTISIGGYQTLNNGSSTIIQLSPLVVTYRW